MTRRHKHVVNVDEASTVTRKTGTKFGATQKLVSNDAGGQELGCMVYEVEPGRAAFPKHYHCATEEAMFILEGEGVLRIGDNDEVAVRAGDYIAFPCGPEGAHQVVNRSDKTLRYLCFSNRPLTDVVVYPDSKKVAMAASDDPAAWAKGKFWVRQIHRLGESLEYFDGEDIG